MCIYGPQQSSSKGNYTATHGNGHPDHMSSIIQTNGWTADVDAIGLTHVSEVVVTSRRLQHTLGV